jgi:invasion protein IalB
MLRIALLVTTLASAWHLFHATGNAESPGEWSHACSTDALTDERTCSALWVPSASAQKPAILLTVTVSVSSNGTKYVAITTPGENVPSLGIRVDKAKAIPTAECRNGVCLFMGKDGATLIGQMSKGKTAIVNLASPTLDSPTTIVPLDGFRAAYEAARGGLKANPGQ